VKLAKLENESAKTRLDQAKQDLMYEMITNYNDLKASFSEFTQARKQLEADTLAFRAAEKKYDQGMINIVDFYTVKNRMANTAGQVLRSELTAEVKKRIIDFYQGNRFWEK
jgi:outer membrane protein